ncbi:hypothetical protein VSDG_03107 [Cytospora chrysosperma]|uniref:Uncharacterized protein n=1 Tax=Cytospora chrysosperma TaxID=252740 RepID=A0A423W8H4_CYTCH|nr:hypothetical protein VSDG_03107 [Valsa sordida]
MAISESYRNMEGCRTWTDLLNGCLGRRSKTEGQSVELTLQINPCGRKLMVHIEDDAAKRTKALERPQAGLPRGNPPSGNASLDILEQPQRRRPSRDLVSNTETAAPVDNQVYNNAWHEMLDSLHNALRHTRYSVSGRMAMSVWGCSRGARDSLSVICPVESKEAVKIWAVSTSGRFAMTDAEPDILTFQSQASSQPRLWRIRIRWLPEQMFEAMPKVEKGLTYKENLFTGEYRTAHVNVVTLPALIDNSASAWADNLAKGISQARLEALTRDVLSILDRVIDLNFQEQGSGPLGAAESRHVLDRAFWVPFTRRYPPAAAMFALCGLGLPSCYMQPQPDTNPGKVYPEGQPRSATRTSTKDAGRSLTARKPVPPRHGQTAIPPEDPIAKPELPVQKASSKDLFSSTRLTEAGEAQVEKGCGESEIDGQLVGQSHRGARKLEGRERGRKRKRRVRWVDKDDRGKERKGSKNQENPQRGQFSVRRLLKSEERMPLPRNLFNLSKFLQRK